jgi:hypothetical protein
MRIERALRKRTERGAVLLLAAVILTVLLFLGASLIERAQSSVSRADAEDVSARSFHLAEAGLHKAVWELNQANGWFTYSGESPIALGGGHFRVDISPDPVARSVFTDQLTVVSTGYLPGPDGAPRLPVTVRAIVQRDPKYFAYAVFGNDKVTIGNGLVTVLADSYISTSGNYGGGNVRANADIGTNSTAASAIEILPMGEVHGNVVVGAGTTTPSGCVSNEGLITGTVSSALTPNLLPSVTRVPPGAIQLGDVYLDSNQQLVLNDGVYHMTDLDILGNAKIVCNGKVVVYIDESGDGGSPDIRIGGNGIVNTSGLPSNLILYCLNDVVNIAISGSAAFYGGIYAPQATISLNSGAVYGSLVGREVDMNDAASSIHYDEVLRDQSNSRASIISWQEL